MFGSDYTQITHLQECKTMRNEGSVCLRLLVKHFISFWPDAPPSSTVNFEVLHNTEKQGNLCGI